MQVVFLGTSGWYDSPTGRTMSILINTDTFSIAFDAGSGFSGLDASLPDDGRPVYLFLSHFHLDHVIGLHALTIHRFTGGLDIYGQPGTRAALGALFAQPYSMPLDKCAFRVSIHDWPENLERLPFRVEGLPLVHASPCYGYRFEIDGRVLAYTTDTGYCANAVTLARGADLLISECSLKPGEVNEGWPHLNPEMAARIAVEGGARRLALAHFDPTNYPTLAHRGEAESAARRIFAETTAAQDGLMMEV